MYHANVLVVRVLCWGITVKNIERYCARHRPFNEAAAFLDGKRLEACPIDGE